MFFGQIGKTRWPPWPLIGWDIFDFFSETAEQNSTKPDRKQDLNVLYQISVFRAHRKNKMAALASDWLIHFNLFLWNRWRKFKGTWQEARSQRLLPWLCFSSRLINKNCRPGRFGVQKGGTLYSGARYVALWASCYFDTTLYSWIDDVNTKSVWLNNLIDVCLWYCIETTCTTLQTVVSYYLQRKYYKITGVDLKISLASLSSQLELADTNEITPSHTLF